ncbi:hypothetical protein PVL29_023543 [Vitis rotundifolia]|uniref:Uncharacterized protein n=1 Tax=Vitis rotundifolia TaxID=103349 RepID=A0AA39D6T9_VITRO|nr:hypothetical protein PVL29_023543 [Vitis rotundifolia]
MLFLPNVCKVYRSPSSPLRKDRGSVDVALFIVWSVLSVPSSVKETLLGWRGSFVGKKHKAIWQAGPLCLYRSIWKARNRIAFEDNVLSIQRLKVSFVYFLWSKTKLFIKSGHSTLIDFIDWVGSR